MGNIIDKKNELLDYVKCLESAEYIISEEEMMILDEFFDKTNDIVISELLDKYSKAIADDKRYLLVDDGFCPKKRFKLTATAIKFPNGFHEHNILYYLEGKYADRFEELGLDEIGISNPHFVHSFSNASEKLHLSYTSPNTRKNFKDTSFAYGLEVDVDVRKKEKPKVYSRI